MWDWISTAMKGLVKVVSEPVNEWQRRKTLKQQQQFELEKLAHEANVQRAKAVLELAKQGQQMDYDLDKIAMNNMQQSWKDEVVLVIFLTPLILAFIPGHDEVALAGFQAIEQMPEWYVAIIVGMVVVIYGMRGLLRAYLTRGKTR